MQAGNASIEINQLSGNPPLTHYDDGKNPSLICPVHGEEYEYFCNNCFWPVCSKCKGCMDYHDIISIDKRVLNRKENIMSLKPRGLRMLHENIENCLKLRKLDSNNYKMEITTLQQRISGLNREISERKSKSNQNNDKIRKLKEMILDIYGSGGSTVENQFVSVFSSFGEILEEDKGLKGLELEIKQAKDKCENLNNAFQKTLGVCHICADALKFKNVPLVLLNDEQWKILSMIEYKQFNFDSKIIRMGSFEAFSGIKELEYYNVPGHRGNGDSHNKLGREDEEMGKNVGDLNDLEVSTNIKGGDKEPLIQPIDYNIIGDNDYYYKCSQSYDEGYRNLIPGILISEVKDIPIEKKVEYSMTGIRTTITPSGYMYYTCLESDNIFVVNLRNLDTKIIENTESHNYVAVFDEKIFFFGQKGKYVNVIDEKTLLSSFQYQIIEKHECSDIRNHIFSSDSSYQSGLVYYCNENLELSSFDLESKKEFAIRSICTYGIVNTLSVPFRNIDLIIYDACKTMCILNDNTQIVPLRCKLIPKYALTLTDNEIQNTLLISINGDVMWKGKIIFKRDISMPRPGHSLSRLHGNVFLFFDEESQSWKCFALKCT